jgi:hypothetical protein
MSNIDNIIVDIENTNQTYGFWIRDENGNIKDDVICGEVIPFLEELKNYEIDMSQDEIKDMISSWDKNWHEESYSLKHGNEYWADNTYNINANIDHDIDYRIAKSDDNGVWFAFMIHRFGDVRGNYTDWAICKFDYVEELFELDSVMQCKYFGEHYVADINIFSETYNVYDTDKCEDVGNFYEMEVSDLLNSITELGIERNE